MRTTTNEVTLTPVTLHGRQEKDVAALRRAIHEWVDSVFDTIEYDAHGEMVNRVTVKKSADVVSVPVMADVDVHLSGERALEIRVSTTFRQMQEEISRINTKDAVEKAERLSAGYTVMREKSSP